MRCEKCGASIPDSAILCDKCGVSVPYYSPAHHEPTRSGRVGWILFVVLLFAVGAYFARDSYESPCPSEAVDVCKKLSKKVEDPLTPDKLRDLAQYPKEYLEMCIELKKKRCY
jgi:hypothetical protein